MVVDPRRDADVYIRIAHENGMHITHIFDTHVHADHISGAQQLRLELQRIGCDMIKGWLKGGLGAWLGKGLKTQCIPHVSVAGLRERLADRKPHTLIDVRNPHDRGYGNLKILSGGMDALVESDSPAILEP